MNSHCCQHTGERFWRRRGLRQRRQGSWRKCCEQRRAAERAWTLRLAPESHCHNIARTNSHTSSVWTRTVNDPPRSGASHLHMNTKWSPTSQRCPPHKLPGRKNSANTDTRNTPIHNQTFGNNAMLIQLTASSHNKSSHRPDRWLRPAAAACLGQTRLRPNRFGQMPP